MKSIFSIRNVAEKQNNQQNFCNVMENRTLLTWLGQSKQKGKVIYYSRMFFNSVLQLRHPLIESQQYFSQL